MKVQLRELRAAHNTALRDKLDSFKIQNFEIVTKYAYYLLQYCDSKGMQEGDYIELTQ